MLSCPDSRSNPSDGDELPLLGPCPLELLHSTRPGCFWSQTTSSPSSASSILTLSRAASDPADHRRLSDRYCIPCPRPSRTPIKKRTGPSMNSDWKVPSAHPSLMRRKGVGGVTSGMMSIEPQNCVPSEIRLPSTVKSLQPAAAIP